MPWRTLIVIALAIFPGLSSVHAAPDPAFTQFIASLWPEAEAQGVTRATFDRETSGLEPDYKLPDLILPGRPATGAPSRRSACPASFIVSSTRAMAP